MSLYNKDIMVVFFTNIQKLISWLYRMRLRIRNFIKDRFLEKFSTNWVVVPIFLFLAWLIICFDYSSVILRPEELSSLFFSIGTITGSMLAIVFAFTSQLISRSNEALSTRFYKAFARDIKIDLSYILLGAITVGEFVLGTINSGGNNDTKIILLKTGILSLLFSIMILYYSYTRLIKLMDNDQLVLILAKKYKKEIDEMNYLAKRISHILNIKHNKTSDKDKRAMQAYVYTTQLHPKVNSLQNHLDGLIELYSVSKEKKDTYAAYNWLFLAFNLIIVYTLSRKYNSSIKYNPKAGLISESDVAAFIQASLEKMYFIWEKALAENDVVTIRKYIRHVQDVVIASLDVQHIERPEENPAYHAAIYNFTEVIENSIKQKNVDALFEASDALNQIAKKALQFKHRIDPTENILKYLHKIIAQASGSDDMYPVLKNGIDSLTSVCNHIFAQDELTDRRLRIMQDYVPNCIIQGVMSDRSLVDITLTVFGDNIFAYASQGIGDNISENQVKKIINTSDLTISILKSLAILSIEMRNGVQSMNRNILVMSEFLFKILTNDKVNEIHKQKIKYLLSELATLPSSLPKLEAVKNFNDIEDFLDKLLQSSLIGVENNQLDYSGKVLSSIFKYLEDAVNSKDSKVSIMDVLRCVNKTKTIGAAAQSLGHKDISKKVIEFIKKIEELYHDKYFPDGFDESKQHTPSPLFLRSDQDTAYGSGVGLPSYFDGTYELFLRHYSRSALDKFEKSIWRFDDEKQQSNQEHSSQNS
jgi:membrane protein